MKRYFSSKHLILVLLLRLLALGSFLPVVATERPTEVVPKAAIFGKERERKSQKPNEQCGVRRRSRPAILWYPKDFL